MSNAPSFEKKFDSVLCYAFEAKICPYSRYICLWIVSPWFNYRFSFTLAQGEV